MSHACVFKMTLVIFVEITLLLARERKKISEGCVVILLDTGEYFARNKSLQYYEMEFFKRIKAF